ncbi:MULTISPECIES: ROK family protein [unclassified Crossiella]|uniref:ROK family protein n=1 Tax=unclassified Crossiella TaxID=2620835 RepID=UPI0020000CB9|nr:MULTISPECIES: ROK family protein [unclassified Crossiella]MCK2238359.1 ROK family protein [Crossiella sp. S99.2]MCK2256399.1 ROK family protein [Crossiella sp. S99.1]
MHYNSPQPTPAGALVFTTVLTRGPLSRVEIGELTGLSSATVTKATRPFLDNGYLVEERAEDPSGRGRPRSPLAIRADREFFLGVKVTAAELIAVVTDLRAGVRATTRRPLPECTPETVVPAIAALVEELLTEPGRRPRVRTLGVAVSGDIDRATGVVRSSPFLGWTQVDLAAQLGAATGLSVLVENDVKALTAAERWFGSGLGASSFALVTLGTGVGCGLVVNGSLVAGAHGVAGELGHVPVVPDGPRCPCGRTGCVEAVAAERAIVARASEVAGTDLSLAEAVATARSGDEPLRAVFAQAGHAIGLGLAALANLVGPERIVVSGEGLAAYDLIGERLRETFTAHAFGAAARCTLELRPLSFEDWARGAAVVGIEALLSPT